MDLPPDHVRLTLRDYQEHTLDRIDSARSRGIRRQLIVLATGLGKTVIFCSLAERMGARTLILAHRDELITQAARKVREVWPGADVGIVKAAQNDVHSQVVVASVQTLARQARLTKLTGAYDGSSLLSTTAPFDLVVIDEAHHAAAASYGRIIDAVGAGKPDGPLLLGATATPDRGDGRGLGAIFDEIVDTRDILWGIRAGYLADLRGIAVRIEDLDLSQVKVKAGDYDQGALGHALEDAGAPAYIVKAWMEHAAGRKTLVFTPTVETARQVAERFQGAGVAAEYIEAGTPLDERHRILRGFSDGTVRVVANCGVLTEGYDEPTVECVAIARQTKSRGLYTQMIGRGTRRHPDKADCLILDVVGASDEHSLVTIPTLFGLEKKYRARASDGTGSVAGLAADQEADNVRLGRIRAEDIELFSAVRGAGIAWVQVRNDGDPRRRYIRPLGRDDRGRPLPTVVLAQVADGDDGWTAGLLWPDNSKTVLMRLVSMDLAQGVAEDYIRRQPSSHITTADAAWRKRKPSPKQLGLARRWKLPVDPAWNAGDLADAIDARIAMKRASKAKART